MTSKPVAFLLADLGVTKTHTRPYISSDNPYSEAHFRTLKYRPEFPDRFDSIEHARAFCREFFDWYNHQHRHSGIGLMTLAAGTAHRRMDQQAHDREGCSLNSTTDRLIRLHRRRTAGDTQNHGDYGREGPAGTMSAIPARALVAERPRS